MNGSVIAKGLLVSGMFALLLPGAVMAKTAAITQYKYYAISGNSPAEIYAAMIKRGPDVNGVNAYASTLATSSQTGRLIAGKRCQVQDYSYRINFVINLPKLKNEAALFGQTKAKWGQFKSFLKSHEETHRSIWMGCAQALESKVRALRTKDCKSLDSEAARLWQKSKAGCDVKHRAWDKAEQKRLLTHPFVGLVLSNQLRTLAALKGLQKRK